MGRIHDKILHAVNQQSYQPMKARILARRLGLAGGAYGEFRAALNDLVQQGRIEINNSQAIRKSGAKPSLKGTYRTMSSGGGFVKPSPVDGVASPEIRIFPENSNNAANGDLVAIQILRRGNSDRPPTGQILSVLERKSHQFVGTYWEKGGEGFVKVDGAVFSQSITIGDPTTKNVKPGDKVVFDMIHFPSPEQRGEGVITELLGPQGDPGVETLAIIRSYNLPDIFPPDVLDEAHHVAENFSEEDFDGRVDYTKHTVVTIDPIDAKDFDDAVQVELDPASGHWTLWVHIADVAHFVKQGGALDREARSRATSIYLPGKVIPMFPETISNHLASLQQDKIRYVQTVVVDFDPKGRKTTVTFERGVIKVKKRFHYEQVMAFLDKTPEAPEVPEDIGAMLERMKTLALILRGRRFRRGALELDMPEPKLEFDKDGRVSGAHNSVNDLSHQIIEEFMLTANEAIAEHLHSLGVKFLRRIHPDPEPTKQKAFAAFIRTLGYQIDNAEDRFTLQRILAESSSKPEKHAVHYAMLRSLKQAVYSEKEEGHYALASTCYCHFTSPIRRYPDLTVHRQLTRWKRTGKASYDETELMFLGEHCSGMERRAALAERDLVKVKLLEFMSKQLGEHKMAIITGVTEYGFFAQIVDLPVEGMVHITTLNDDNYLFDAESHSLTGLKYKRRYRLGDKIEVEIAKVDIVKKQMDLRPVIAMEEQKKKPNRK